MIRLALALTLLAGPAFGDCSAPSRPMTLTASDDTVYATGQIVEGNAAALSWLVGAHHAREIVLDSNGGEIAEAAAMADIIRVAGLRVTVKAGAQCASACFMLLAAGQPKSVSLDSRIGVHRGATCTADSPVGTTIMAEKSVAFGAPAGIIRRMISTPQPGIAWLSPQELAEMGVRFR